MGLLSKLLMRPMIEQPPEEELPPAFKADKLIFCQNCETIFYYKYHSCPTCGSNSCLSVKRIIK